MKTTTKTLSASALLACVAFGCDPQADSAYPGEPLLSLKGAIVAEPGVALDSDVVPVLTWYERDQDDFSVMSVQDLAVRGDFPSKFELAIHEPPRAELLSKTVRGYEDEPRGVLGHIAALPRKHDAEIYLGLSSSASGIPCETDEETGLDRCANTLCDYYGQCFEEVLVCDEDFECTSETDAPPRLQNGLGILSGFVNNYALMYLDREAKPGSVTAWQFGVERLDAGFHLVRFLDEGEYEEADVDDPCLEEAWEVGSKRFEKAYGMDADEVEVDSPEEDASFMYFDAAAMELGCEAARGVEFEFVELSQRITMTLGDELVLW